MGPPAPSTPAALGPGGPLTATVVLFLFLLASRDPSAEACLNCGAQFKNLRVRFAQLCARYRERFHQASCSDYPWRGEAVRDFALDEAALDLLLEKAHRVLRVIEIKQSFANVPKFWNWLHEVKMPGETREEVVASLFNCSTCRRVEMPCWDVRTCYPEYQGLPKVIQLLLILSGSCFLLGLVSCALE
ncbi:sperm-egg fusion protein TMEM95 [Liasis olivaceus]